MLVPKLRFKREDGSKYPEWVKVPLSTVCDIVGGGTPSTEHKEYWNSDIQWFTPSEIGKSKYVSKSARTISKIGFEKSSARKLPVGTILLTSRATLGEMAIASEECTTNQGFQSLIPQSIYGEYLYYLQPIIKHYCNQKACGSTFNEISKSELGKCIIPNPCLEEQKKIADFLSTVDEVIAQSEAEVQNFEQQKKAAMQKIFSQEVRFKREDGTDYPEWEEDSIGNCVNVTSCKRVHQSDWTDSGVPFYRAREIVALYNNEPITPLHISTEKYNALSKISGMISSGDLLVTGVGTIGVPYLVKESDKFYFKDGNIIWFQNEEKRALGSFLYYTLSTNEFQTKILQDSGKGTVHTFTIANAKETIIAIPCLEEQQKIADFLSAYDEAIRYAKQELDKWKELKKGLLQQMFV